MPKTKQLTQIQREEILAKITKYNQKKLQIDYDLRQPIDRGNQYSKMFKKSQELGYKIEELTEKLLQQ
jgi:16S rRNA U1498 N3-methylase RsmE